MESKHPRHPHTPEFSFCPKCGGTLERRVLKPSEPRRLVCSSCDFVFYLDPKIAAGCIVEFNGGIVLLKRAIEPAQGKWVFPGGYVDQGERVEDAAIRETWEESRLEVRVTSLLGVYSYSGRPVIVVVFAGEVDGGQLEAADEALEAATFLAQDVPWNELAFPSTFEALAEYVRRFHGVQPPEDVKPPGAPD